MDTKIAITTADGRVAIMNLLTIGRGDALPFGAEWVDKSLGQWMREPTPAVIDYQISRMVWESPVVSWRIVDAADIPRDRTYRNALRDKGGKLEHDVDVAKGLHRELLRHARATKLVELDGEWMKATGQGKKQEADAIEAERQRLRDMPADPAIDAAKTCEDLKAVWPADLTR